MRDVYPITLFTFNCSIKLLREGKFEAFVYVFVYALWNEAILNKKIDNTTRIYLLQILLQILIFLYDVFKSKKLPTNIGFKKSKNIQFVTIFTIEKLQRWIATCLLYTSI